MPLLPGVLSLQAWPPKRDLFADFTTMQTQMQQRLSRPHRHAVSRRPLAVKAAQSQSRMVIKGHTITSPAGWEHMKDALREAGVKLLSPQEVIFQQEKGVPVIDVRPEADYDKGHIPGSINIPMYRPIQGWDMYSNARRLGYALFGVLQGTELNPTFAEEVATALGDSAAAGVILYCSQGGSLDPVETSKRGRQSRSLVAAYDLTTRGVASTVTVMKGGFNEWTNGGRDIEVLEYVESS